MGMLGRLPPPSSPDRNWLAAERGLSVKACTGRPILHARLHSARLQTPLRRPPFQGLPRVEHFSRATYQTGTTAALELNAGSSYQMVGFNQLPQTKGVQGALSGRGGSVCAVHQHSTATTRPTQP